MGYRWTTLLELRQRAEEDADKRLAATSAAHAREAEEQSRLQEHAAATRRLVQEARAGAVGATAAEALARERFRARLAEQAQKAARAAAAHREGALAAAVRALNEARKAQLEARREREALDQHRAKDEARARVAALRREEEAQGELALAAHLRKPR